MYLMDDSACIATPEDKLSVRQYGLWSQIEPIQESNLLLLPRVRRQKNKCYDIWLWLFSLLHLPYLWYPHILWVIVCNLAPSILVADRKMHFLLAKIASECAVQPHWPFKGLKDPFWYLPLVGPKLLYGVNDCAKKQRQEAPGLPEGPSSIMRQATRQGWDASGRGGG